MDSTDETLADVLRARIIDGELQPGARLSEHALSAAMGVSRNTLREAFRVLAEQRLVEHVPHRGVSVAFPTTADVIDIYRVRRAIECSVLRAASPLHPAVTAMREAVDRAAANAVDEAPIGTANMAFHAALVDLGDSPRLAREFRNVSAELRLVFLAINDDRLHRPFIARNRTVLDRLESEGAQAAADELERYLIDSERRVLGAFTRLGFG